MANSKFYGKMYSCQEAASFLKVTHQTVLKYIRNGYLSATDLSCGTKRPIYGIQEEDLVDFDLRKSKSIKRGRKLGSKNKSKEIDILKKQVKELSDELFNICVRLEELSK